MPRAAMIRRRAVGPRPRAPFLCRHQEVGDRELGAHRAPLFPLTTCGSAHVRLLATPGSCAASARLCARV